MMKHHYAAAVLILSVGAIIGFGAWALFHLPDQLPSPWDGVSIGVVCAAVVLYWLANLLAYLSGDKRT